MESKRAKDLMFPINEYAKVHKSDSLLDVLNTLEKHQKELPENRHPHRAVLVVDKKDKIVGKIGHHQFLRALEPKYRTIQETEKLTGLGVDSKYLDSMVGSFRLWEDNWEELCKRASKIKAVDVMHPVEEHIDENATITKVIHKMIMWKSLSVLVTRKSKIVGILRMSDLFEDVAGQIREVCERNK